MKKANFEAVWSPVAGWVVGVAPLPSNPTLPPSFKRGSLVFAEGAELLLEPPNQSEEKRDRLIEVADHHPEKLHTFPGDFGFIRLRPGGEATIVRSCGGLAPLYIHRSKEHISVGTRLGDFVRYLPQEPGLDPLTNALWLTGCPAFPYDRTFLAGVSVVPRGHFRRIGPGGVAGARYWHPVRRSIPRPNESQRREHAMALRGLLQGRIAKDLDPEGGNLLSLSGGIDSSALGALAGKTHKVSSISLVPPGGRSLQHELSYINPIVGKFAFERTWFFGIEDLPLLSTVQKEPKVAFQVIHPILMMLPDIASEFPIKVLFGGEFADEVCGAAGTIPDWSCVVSPPRLAQKAMKGELPTGSKDLLRWGKHRLLSAVGKPMIPLPSGLPPFVQNSVREEYQAWRLMKTRDAAGFPPIRRTLSVHETLDGFVAMNWEVTTALGIRRSLPFVNREVLELSYGMHPEELIGPGTKKPLKLALASDVPARNLNRPDSGQWADPRQFEHSVEWEGKLPHELSSIVTTDWVPVPPGTLPWRQARRLAQILRFIDGLQTQRC